MCFNSGHGGLQGGVQRLAAAYYGPDERIAGRGGKELLERPGGRHDSGLFRAGRGGIASGGTCL